MFSPDEKLSQSSTARNKAIDSLANIQVHDTEKRKKLERKRLHLAMKIFSHIKATNEEYLSNVVNFIDTDDSVTFSQFEKPPKIKQPQNDLFQPIKPEFDHLSLFRPYLNIIDTHKPERVEKIHPPKFTLKKVSPTESQKWIQNIVWNAADINADYRNDIHTIKAGWIPASNQRTWNQFLTNGVHQQEVSSFPAITYRNMSASLHMITPQDPDHLNIDPSKWFSLFPTDKFDDYISKTIVDFDGISLIKSDYLRLDPMTALDSFIDAEIEKHERIPIRAQIAKINLYGIDSDGVVKFLSHGSTFNISADEYYWPEKSNEIIDDEIYKIQIKHSLPALDLQRTFFPTYMDILHLRRWHRSLLTDYHHGNKMKIGTHTIQNLKKYNEESLKIYQEIMDATKSDEIFLMKSLKDISALNGHLVLLEYSEEFPIFLNQIGMNSIIRVYYNKAGNLVRDTSGYGEHVELPTNISPFLGNLSPGQSLMAVENHMFRAPLFFHRAQSTDFLMIKNTHGYFIRQIPGVFIVGQEHPKIEVPSPNSKAAMRCARERVQLYIFSLFMKNKEIPKRIKIASIRRAFKQNSENSIRKRLKLCANYLRQTGLSGKSNWWVLKNDFRLPTFEDMHHELQPEAVCAYYSMLAAQRRLKDAGYGKKSLFMAEEENDDDINNNKILDEEILCAPWHTTRAFIMCLKGKCLMSINGFADPTGCGEGFSFVRMNYKGAREESSKHTTGDLLSKRSRSIGFEADVKKLRVNVSRQILFEMGYPQERIDRMNRWDMVNAIKNLATGPKAAYVHDMVSRNARSSRFTGIESMEKFKESCQGIFDRQNQILSSNQEFSSDEEVDEDISDLEELNKDLESMLKGQDDKRIKCTDEDEEIRKLDLIRLLNENRPLMEYEENNPIDEQDSPLPNQLKIDRLLIHRTFIEDEKEFVRTEVVADPRIITAYLRITKNKNYRQVYAKHDIKTIEELRKEKKRVQDQLRRIKRNEERDILQKGGDRDTAAKDKPIKLHVRCSACNGVGHMRTNRICPRYSDTHPREGIYNIDKSEESISSETEKPIELVEPIQNVIKVEGTKLILNKSIVDAADELTRKSITLKIPKDILKRKKRAEDLCYYGNKNVRTLTSRRRADPKIYLNAILEELVSRLRESPHSWPFQQPVCPKKVPDYYTIIKRPVNLLTLRDATKVQQYEHRDQFLEELKLLESNSILYNGYDHPITHEARALIEQAVNELKNRNKELSMIEIEINPLLSTDPQLRISWIFENIVNSTRSLPAAHPFLCPVNSKLVRDYHLYIQKPMDLETVKTNALNNMYPTRETFLKDIELILSNCIQYNGVNHAYTKMAHEIHDHVVKLIQKDSEILSQYEEELRKQLRVPVEKFNTSNPKDSSKSQLKETTDSSVHAKLLDDLVLSEDDVDNHNE